MKTKNVLGIIPARYNSSRLPGKPLADISGKPMIQWVYERSLLAELTELVVATDDIRVFDAVTAFGGKVIMTSPSHTSGTSRICEVAEMKKFENFNYFINIQGDQPLIEEYTIRTLNLGLIEYDHNEAAVTTLVTSLSADEENNHSVAKVVTDKYGKALYFSRSLIPNVDSGTDISHFYTDFLSKKSPYLKHLGIYGFTKEAVNRIRKMKPSYLERTEKLEQLTWLYEGIPVYTTFGADVDRISVDTPEDLIVVREVVRKWEKQRKR